ncbi:Homeodomain-like domain-containing protein [Nitrosomonas sp. Nm34]|nr:Homeodomain-like domain-containing protein [Nitrosomonas sp. Nm34]
MRYSASEKFEIIRLVEQSSLSVRQTLLQLGIRGSTFYNWLKRYQSDGIDGTAGRELIQFDRQMDALAFPKSFDSY